MLDTFKVLQAEDGDVLVPEGLQWQKFTNYADEPGVSSPGYMRSNVFSAIIA